FRAAETAYPIAVGLKQPAQGIAHSFVIIDDEYGIWRLKCCHACNSCVSSAGRCAGVAHGRVKRKMVPPSGLALAQRRPWCDSIIVRQILSPMPRPSDLVL